MFLKDVMKLKDACCTEVTSDRKKERHRGNLFALKSRWLGSISCVGVAYACLSGCLRGLAVNIKSGS